MVKPTILHGNFSAKVKSVRVLTGLEFTESQLNDLHVVGFGPALVRERDSNLELTLMQGICTDGELVTGVRDLSLDGFTFVG